MNDKSCGSSSPSIAQLDISDQDVLQAMKELPGYLDITTGDFKEVYRLALRHALMRIRRTIKARDIMTSPAIHVAAKTSLQEVALLLADAGVTGAPVVDEDGMVVGVISERNFLRAMSGGSPISFMGVVANCLTSPQCLAMPMKKAAAAVLMSTPAVIAKENDTLEFLTDLMTIKGINRLPIVNDEGLLVGIVTRSDLVKGFAQGAWS